MATTVTIGGETVTPTVVSDTELQITTPPADAAGAVDVVVTTAGGSTTAAGAFEYVDEPNLAVEVPETIPVTVAEQATYATRLTNFGARAEDVTEEIRISNAAGDLVAADVVYETQDSDGETWTTVTWTEDAGSLVVVHTWGAVLANADNSSNVRVTVARDTGDLTGSSTYTAADDSLLAQAVYTYDVSGGA